MQEGNTKETAHCTSCGSKMDITGLAPYTNVICPHCDHHTRVKCELGPYLLTGRHAAGGMSMVFSARDLTLDREVALKILNSTYSQDQVRMAEFEKEAQITAGISHPHVVKVFTVGQEHGQFYIAMELVPGENMEQRMNREGALPEDTVLPIASEVISGLSAAKDAGLIHRDVKPGNILFDAKGHAKIVDFGLSLITQGGKAKASEIWATPYYVPPEALDGLEEDFRSDIYALGSTLYHVLSGKPPISEESKSTRAVRQAKNSIPPLASVAPWLKEETCYLVDKAMAIEPSDRFSSYAEMEAALLAATQSLQHSEAATPIRSEQRAQRRVKKSSTKGIGSLIAISLIALILIAVAIFTFINKDDPVVETPPPAVPPTEPNNDDYSPETLARIAEYQRRAHKQLAQSKYPEAKHTFLSLMQDSEVREPTASWAAVEAYIADLLSDNGTGNTTLKQLHQHIRRKGDLPDSRIRAIANQLGTPGIVRNPEIGNDALGIIPLTAAAAKNWELGRWELAATQFTKIKEHPIPQGNPLGVYHHIADQYLSDYALLSPFRKIELPSDIDACNQLRKQLSQLLPQLKTARQGGRTRFNLRYWQLSLAKHHRKLRQQIAAAEAQKNRPPSYQEILPKFHQLIAESKFAAASALLDKTDAPRELAAQKEAWMYLADSASTFIVDLSSAIPERGVAVPMKSKDGRSFVGVLSGNEQGLKLKGKKDAELAWKDIEPASLLAVHTKVSNNNLKTIDGQIALEQALCYCWLTGQKDKATNAATKLSEQSNNFRMRWQEAMKQVSDQ